VRVRGRDQRPGEPGAVRARGGAVRTGTRRGGDVRAAAARLRDEDQRGRRAQGVCQRLCVRRGGQADRGRRAAVVAAALSVAGAP